MFTQNQIKCLHCSPVLTTGLEGISSNLRGNTLKYPVVCGYSDISSASKVVDSSFKGVSSAKASGCLNVFLASCLGNCSFRPYSLISKLALGALPAHASVSEIHSCFFPPRPSTLLYRNWPPSNSSVVRHAHCGKGQCKYSLVLGLTSIGTLVSALVPFKSLRDTEGGELEFTPASFVSYFPPSLSTPLSTVAWKGRTDDGRGG